MNWKFWKRKHVEEEQVPSEVHLFKKEMTSLQENFKNLDTQLNKMIRLQFKTTKNTEEKLDGLGTALDSLRNENELVQQYKNREERTASNIIRLLDELDHVSSEFNETEQALQTVFTQWTNTLMEILEDIGIYQLDVLGKSFDPLLAEALQTVKKSELISPPEVPYQVIQILQRGYESQNGQLVRKAKVITVKECD